MPAHTSVAAQVSTVQLVRNRGWQDREVQNTPKVVGGDSAGSANGVQTKMHGRAAQKSAAVRNSWAERLAEMENVGLFPCKEPDAVTQAPCGR